MAVCGKEDHGKPRQSQVPPGTARYSAEKDPSCAIFTESRRFEDIKYDTEWSLVDHLGSTCRPLVDHYFSFSSSIIRVYLRL